MVSAPNDSKDGECLLLSMVIDACGQSGVREFGDLLGQLPGLSSFLCGEVKEVPQLTPVLFFLVVFWVNSSPGHSKSAYTLRDNSMLW